VTFGKRENIVIIEDTFDYKILMGPFQVESPHIQPISLCLSVLCIIYKYLTILRSNTRTGGPLKPQPMRLVKNRTTRVFGIRSCQMLCSIKY